MARKYDDLTLSYRTLFRFEGQASAPRTWTVFLGSTQYKATASEASSKGTFSDAGPAHLALMTWFRSQVTRRLNVVDMVLPDGGGRGAVLEDRHIIV